MLSVRFWGVRGSIPCPGPDTVIYGGNTSCLEIRADGRLIIIDLGTGVRPLGDWLVENDLKTNGKIKADIFLTHTHWDHIMGFPMFNPIYMPGTELHITAPDTMNKESLKSIIETQLSPQFWPVKADELAASIKYAQIKETVLDLGDGLTISTKYLNHPISCLGYRVNFKGKSIATVYDHEHYRGNDAAEKENEKIREFIKGADIVIHDAHYTQNEYDKHSGWGHCSQESAVNAASGINVKKIVLFHHEPSHTDSIMNQLAQKFAGNSNPVVLIAKEGMTLEA